MVITLIGYRGSGKSAIARPLAEKLAWQSVDADEEIERRAGCTIREIFQTEGEPAFRDREQAVLADLTQKDRLVIAAGGGVILREENRRAMKQAGPVIWLQASAETLERRIRGDATTGQRRPNLTAGGGRQEIEELLTLREPLYRQCATLTVSTDNRPVEEIVAEILQAVQSDLGRGV